MSVGLPRSGIVLYPVGSEIAHMSLSGSGPGGEEAFQAAMNMVHPDVQSNIARQLGAATNAYLDGADKSIRLGTAIAVPYSASVAHEINTLRHFDTTGFLRVGSDAEPILDQERALLNELAESTTYKSWILPKTACSQL